jgi:hypothetical protein
VASRSIFVSDVNCANSVPTVYVAAKTWVEADAGAGWCLTMLRYNYVTGAAIESPYRYPAEPTATNYFVPTGMTVVTVACEGAGDGSRPTDIWLVVTGYSPAASYGNTDYHTVCFNGNLTVRWSHTYSRPGLINDVYPVDEYAVAIDHASGVNYITSSRDPVETQVAGVTGNTWNGSTWDMQTIFYDIFNNGQVLGVVTSSTSNDDLACGIRMFGDSTGTYPNARSYVVGTQGASIGNAIAAYRYTASSTTAGSWVSTTRSLTVSGATLKANAMEGDYLSGTSGDFAFAAGRIAGIDQSHMLLAKFDFDGGTQNYTYGENGYYTSFSYEASSTAPRAGEALCIAHKRTESIGTLIALGGYSYRDSSHGNDSCVALFNESSGQPVLRWSAWTKAGTSNAYDVQDVCTALAIDGDRDGGVASLDDFFVHCAAQLPTSTTDMNLRAIVFSSDDDGVTAGDPGTKSSSGAPVDVSGTASGGDIPRHLELVNSTVGFGDLAHNFIVAGDVWNGTTNGFDVLTRRFRFTEPE